MSAFEWGLLVLGFIGGGGAFTAAWWIWLRVITKRSNVQWHKKNITVEKGQDDV